MSAQELNLDGLVGPTHNYAGLSFGNVASKSHGGKVSNPRAAALQGLAKMKRLADLGIPQAVLPPLERPDVVALRRFGFTGRTETDVIAQAARDAPGLLAACCSASSMWAANAATVSPSADAADGRVHFTAANLASHVHRSLETESTSRALRVLFPDQTYFAHHPPVPTSLVMSDEGAANHTRLCPAFDQPGVQWFVFGRHAMDDAARVPRRYPARQTFEASQTVARLHGLSPSRTLYAQQHPDAIDAGVFHNDVIAVGHRDVLLLHEDALLTQPKAVDDLRRAFSVTCGGDLTIIEVPRSVLSIEDAVATYLFNSQLVGATDGGMTLICPVEAVEHPRVSATIDRIVADATNPIKRATSVDTRQSMANGGGPACLRLRVALTDDELAAMHQPARLTPTLFDALSDWVQRHYRDALAPDDLADPSLIDETRHALDELTRIMQLGDTYYPFQR